MIKPQYVDHIPKAVRGNVLEVLKQRDQKDLLPRLLQELDLQQVWMCGGRWGEKCGESVGTDTEWGFSGRGTSRTSCRGCCKSWTCGDVGGESVGADMERERSRGRQTHLSFTRTCLAPCTHLVTGH